MSAQNIHLALINHYVAKKTEAIAMIELLYNKSFAISEHTNIIDETRKWVEILDQSESCINTLNGLFKEPQTLDGE